MATEVAPVVRLTDYELAEHVKKLAAENKRSMGKQVEFMLEVALGWRGDVPRAPSIESVHDEFETMLAVSVHGIEGEEDFYAKLHKNGTGSVGLDEHGVLIHVSPDGTVTELED